MRGSADTGKAKKGKKAGQRLVETITRVFRLRGPGAGKEKKV